MMKQEIAQQRQMTDWRWRAVNSKNREFDGVFYFGVRTTGVFCRPSCSSKSAKRENVRFFETTGEAETAGFRACLRCQPKKEYVPSANAVLLARAFELLQSEDAGTVTIGDLSSSLNVSSGHLQKTFKSILDLSPKDVLNLTRIEKFKREVKQSGVTTSLYASGFGSSRALYEKAGATLGMTPATYKKGGAGVKINYAVADSRLGKLLVAATAKGICAISFGDTSTELEDGLKREFLAAVIEKDAANLQNYIAAILRNLAGEHKILDLPLDVRATAFQMRVWAELRKIPYGETRSYKEIAEQLGDINVVRAVARACATNPVALINPCHRVIAADGKLSGYAWGIERKKAILEKEKPVENPNKEENL